MSPMECWQRNFGKFLHPRSGETQESFLGLLIIQGPESHCYWWSICHPICLWFLCSLVVSLQFGVAIPYFGQIKQIHDPTSDRHQECWWSLDTMMLLSISFDHYTFAGSSSSVRQMWSITDDNDDDLRNLRSGLEWNIFLRKESVTALFKICTSLL